MSADPPPVVSLREDPDATPRAEEAVADAGRTDAARGPEHPASGAPVPAASQPVAGGTDDGPPVQGEGAPDSY